MMPVYMSSLDGNWFRVKGNSLENSIVRIK